jgi:hypothetical protein
MRSSRDSEKRRGSFQIWERPIRTVVRLGAIRVLPMELVSITHEDLEV